MNGKKINNKSPFLYNETDYILETLVDEYTANNLNNIKSFYDAVNYLNTSGSNNKNHLEYKLRKKTKDLFIIPERREDNLEENIMDNSFTDAHLYSLENVTHNNPIKSIEIHESNTPKERSRGLVFRPNRSFSKSFFKKTNNLLQEIEADGILENLAFTDLKKGKKKNSTTDDYLLSKLQTNDDDSPYNNNEKMISEANDEIKEFQINNINQLTSNSRKNSKELNNNSKKNSLNTKILIIESKNNSIESSILKNTSFLENPKNLKDDINIVNNSLFFEDENRSVKIFAKNSLNESLDDRKNKLLMKSEVSNRLSIQNEMSNQKTINKYEKSEIFNSCKSSKIILLDNSSFCSSKSKNLSRFWPNNTLYTQQPQHIAQNLNFSEIGDCNNSNLDIKYITKSLFDKKINNNSLFEKINVENNKEILKNKGRCLISYTPSTDNTETKFNTIFDVDFIKNMIDNEKEYIVDPNFFLKHDNLRIEYRSLLIDWIMEICEDFAYKRDTFHNAVNYIDRYFSFCERIEKDELQLIGCVCLSIAAKFEEVQIPKIEEYIKVTEGSTVSQFIEKEREVLLTLEWKLFPTTINTWTNWFLSQWDIFLDSFTSIRDKIIQLTSSTAIYFKRPDSPSYKLYKKISQIIDVIVLDHNYYIFNYRMIVASTLFLILAQYYNIISSDLNKLSDLNYLNMICYQKRNVISEVFGEFLLQSFGFKFQEIFFSIIYVSKFLSFDFNYDLPLVTKIDENFFNNGNYEEFLSYQTRNQNNYPFIASLLASNY